MANLILSGSKVWKITCINTNIHGKISLIKSGSKKIFGECNVIDSKKLSLLNYQNNIDNHCIEDGLNILPYKNKYAWLISKTKKYKDPILINIIMGL